MITGGMEICGS